MPPKGLYRGVVTKMRVSLALAFTGETNIELIQQHDEEPSVFRETLKARGAHGFHHWAVGARDFEKSVAHYRSLGYAEAFSDTAPMGFRVVYFDTTRDLPGMLEVIEMNAAAEQGFHAMYQAAQEWDGKNFTSCIRSRRRNRHEPIEHDPEKWKPVFRIMLPREEISSCR